MPQSLLPRRDELHRPWRLLPGRALSIAILDVDGFKQFNDSYGHPAGDAALRTLAAALRGSARRSDVVARYGGEEFVIILTETRVQEAVAKLDALREEVGTLPIETPRASWPGRLTVSAGVASWPDDGAWPDELLHAADDRLLAAKRAGRNRVFGPRDRGAADVVSPTADA